MSSIKLTIKNSPKKIDAPAKSIASWNENVKGSPTTKKSLIYGIHPNISTLKTESILKTIIVNSPTERATTEFTICCLFCKKPLDKYKNKKRNNITKNPVPNLPSYPQNDIHGSLAKIVETKNDKNSNKNTLSKEDLITLILPSHIHLITSNRIIKHAKKIKTILFILSVESKGKGIINQGIKNSVKYRTHLCIFDIKENTEEVVEFFSSDIAGQYINLS